MRGKMLDFMTYLQAPPDAGPSVTQVTSGLQNSKCAGRRLVEIGGRLPIATQFHQSFVKILSKHLAANKRVSFAFQQKSSTLPIMNPSPSEIVDLFSFVEVTLMQYATVAGHFPGVTAASAKPRPKRVNKVDVVVEEQSKEATQANATTPKPKAKGQGRGPPQTSPPKHESKPPETKKGGKGGGQGKRGKSESRPEKTKHQYIPFFRGTCEKGDQCKCEHQVDNDERPVPVGPEILQSYDEAVKQFNENRAQAKRKRQKQHLEVV